MSDQRTFTFLLVDDDPTFGRILKQKASARGISVILCLSLDNPELLAGKKFDAAIIDYDLGDVTGPELGSYLNTVLNGLPLVLISSTERSQNEGVQWPKTFIEFTNKNAGYDAILDAALRACQKVLSPKE